MEKSRFCKRFRGISQSQASNAKCTAQFEQRMMAAWVVLDGCGVINVTKGKKNEELAMGAWLCLAVPGT
jgi:hypothetical protein